MNRIEKKFKELKKQKKKAFIAYVAAGDPNLSATKKIVFALEDAGVDIVELGIPFSDPIADGPTIQAASHRALQKGATLNKIFSLVSDLRRSSRIPIIFMTYYNPVFKHGVDNFVRDCKSCGVDGVIVPDLPCEEAKDLKRAAGKSGLAMIFLAAPTSTGKRVRDIAKNSSGFIYYVSLTGVTGARNKLPVEVASKVRAIKALTDKPVAVGFGISNSAQARDIARAADGVIVGSAIVKIIAKYATNEKKMLNELSKFSKNLARAIHGV